MEKTNEARQGKAEASRRMTEGRRIVLGAVQRFTSLSRVLSLVNHSFHSLKRKSLSISISQTL
ncbi:hypothetical protein Mapa_011408 [Marchantia paleacea]|nr:hypothetical protein Mapa_011408 [Marchantia paleacea]